jgi:hypothetical protein
MAVATLVLALVIAVKLLNASGPIAVYALVDKATFRPDADHPQRILIYGVFATPGKDPPSRGERSGL